MMTGSLKKIKKIKKIKKKKKKKKGGCSVIRACSLIRSNTVYVKKVAPTIFRNKILKTLPHVMISSTISLTMEVVSIVDDGIRRLQRYRRSSTC